MRSTAEANGPDWFPIANHGSRRIFSSTRSTRSFTPDHIHKIPDADERVALAHAELDLEAILDRD
jgi:hypothetical protein